MSINEDMKRILSDERLDKALQDHGSAVILDYESDKDIVGAITGQRDLFIKGIPDLTEQQIHEIHMITNAVVLKLGALRYHCRNFKDIQNRRLREVSNEEIILDKIKEGALFCERGLTYEFESFLYQFKSALDMLVKLVECSKSFDIN